MSTVFWVGQRNLTACRVIAKNVGHVKMENLVLQVALEVMHFEPVASGSPDLSPFVWFLCVTAQLLLRPCICLYVIVSSLQANGTLYLRLDV